MGTSGGEEITVLQEIADSCRGQQWSAAIRLLGSISGFSSSPILLCNRAMCYSKLELYKHAVKDCDRALALNSVLLQAYLYKGQALVALGKQEEGSSVWQLGYKAGLSEPTDLQLLLELYTLANRQKPQIPLQAQKCVKQSSKNSTTGSTGVTENAGSNSVKTHRNQVSPLLVADIALARGIAQVNAGNYVEAVKIFTQLIKENPGSAGALVGRGTAYAFQRQLKEAIFDFTKALELDPSAAEAWKRRGQARAAVGPSSEAIADLSKALAFQPNSPDILYERGVVYYKLKDFESAIVDLRASLALNSTNKYAYNYYGLALISTGDYIDGMSAYYKAVKCDPSFKEAWTHLAKFHKELGDSESCLQCLEKVLSIDAKYVHGLRLKALLLFSLGHHRDAAKELTTGLEMEPHNTDCHYLRGSCYHAIGNYAEAIKEYDRVLDNRIHSGEALNTQSLAFYQREIALYTFSKINEPFDHFDIDTDLDPVFKEAWCKRLSPVVLLPAYKLQTFPKDLISSGSLKHEDLALTKSRTSLLEAADKLGHLIQYNCPGFLKNVRQHRMAGLAILDIAQKVATALQGSVINKKVQQLSVTGQWREDGDIEELNKNLNEVSSSSNDASVPDPFHGSSHIQRSNWRGLYSIAVKWRQASEPCDPVVWVDMLSESQYAAGFGSHTPMLLGQAKVVRYYPNFPRSLVVAKELMLEKRCVFDAENRPVHLSDPLELQAVDAAANCSDMYDVIGEDFWLVTPCHSTAVQGKVLEGTRFTLQKGVNGYDFSIRTPCTPPRWADYDEEMTAMWEEYCILYSERAKLVENAQRRKQLQDCILRLSFYWYNFMPLARGTACVGYIVLLGLFLAADMEITASIPKGLQVDWEAILSPHPSVFIQAVEPWLYPSMEVNTSWKDLPNVSETFVTLGSAIAALSSQY